MDPFSVFDLGADLIHFWKITIETRISNNSAVIRTIFVTIFVTIVVNVTSVIEYSIV